MRSSIYDPFHIECRVKAKPIGASVISLWYSYECTAGSNNDVDDFSRPYDDKKLQRIFRLLAVRSIY